MTEEVIAAIKDYTDALTENIKAVQADVKSKMRIQRSQHRLHETRQSLKMAEQEALEININIYE